MRIPHCHTGCVIETTVRRNEDAVICIFIIYYYLGETEC